MNLTKVFLDNLKVANDGMTATTDPKEKARLAVQIALAVATTGAVTNNSIEEYLSAAKNGNEESLKPSASKGTKKKSSKKKSEPEEPVEDPKENENAAETEDDEEWTDAMKEKYAEELEELSMYFLSEEEGGWGEDYMCNECIYEFSEHASNDKSFITPLNIQAFLIYLHGLVEE